MSALLNCFNSTTRIPNYSFDHIFKATRFYLNAVYIFLTSEAFLKSNSTACFFFHFKLSQQLILFFMYLFFFVLLRKCLFVLIHIIFLDFCFKGGYLSTYLKLYLSWTVMYLDRISIILEKDFLN